MRDDVVRWGIAGPGRIAGAVAADLALVRGAELVAVGSRALDRAQAFAATHGVARAHGSYRALVEDPDVDVVYVATPHPQHRAVALAAIGAGKAVLVEKAFTATLAGAEEVVAAARAAGVFAMEAMWTRFHPAVAHLRALLADGALGAPRAVQADLGAFRPFDAADRLFAPDLGGGALLDLGVYVVSFAQMVLGRPTEVVARGSLAPNGVDLDVGLLLTFAGGATATLLASLGHHSPSRARVDGTGGWAELMPRFHHPRGLVVSRAGGAPEAVELPPTGIGFTHELVEVTEAVRAGRTESAVMPLDDTLAVQAVLEEAGRQLGVSFRDDVDLPS
jgi:predicted dehydrogenase